MKPKMIFHQLFDQETSTYTYLLGAPQTREAIIIDPVKENVERDLKLLSELNLKLKYILDTHIHADHVTGANDLRKRTGAKTGVSQAAHVDCADILLKENDVLHFGPFQIKVLETPGHTDGCLSFYCEDRVFTGDALLIRGTGRTDFQNGSSEKLFDSIRGKLFSLPNKTKVFPGHDYNGHTMSTIGLEKSFNPRINQTKSREEFLTIMGSLKLDLPKKLHLAVPANQACGQSEERGPTWKT